MAQNIDIIGITKLGFSEYDGQIYTKLAELKVSTADPLISATGLHRSVVYTSLKHLLARKLISETEIKGKKQFSLVSPTLLVEEFEEKRELASQVAGKISSLLQSDVQEITIHQGNDEYLSLLTSLIKTLPHGATKYVLGTGGEEFMKQTMLPIWQKYHNVAKKQGIQIKMIGYDHQKESIEPYTAEEGIYETKYLPSTMENPAGIHIYPEAGVVLNIIYSDATNVVTAIKIKNRAFVQSNLNLFNNLWVK